MEDRNAISAEVKITRGGWGEEYFHKRRRGRGIFGQCLSSFASGNIVVKTGTSRGNYELQIFRRFMETVLSD